MTIHTFVDKLTQLFWWLYYRHQWQTWEALAVAGAAALLLLATWALRKQRDKREARARAQMIHQGVPTIGIRLAARNHNPVSVTEPKRRRLPFVAGQNNGETCPAEPSTASSRTAGPLQNDAVTRQQTEACLQQQLEELKAINEKLQSQNNQCKQTEDRLRRRMVKLMAASKKLRQQLGKPEETEESLRRQADAGAAQRIGDNLARPMKARTQAKWSPLDILAPNRLYRNGRNARRQGEEPLTMDADRPSSRRTREPLDVEKLKAIAALAKQIQSRPRRA